MKETSLVSVLMTVYNREKYIADAIESVISSSYKNWELIIVDDGSKDNSYEIAKKYIEKDGRIRLFKNKKNLGQFANRNKAAEYANGKYIKYLDSDDIIYPQGLEIMVNSIEKYPEAGMAFSSNSYRHDKILPIQISSEDAIKYHFFVSGFLYPGPSGTIYRTTFFRNLGGFRNFGVASDYEFNLRASLSCPIVLFQRDLFYWRKHDNQEINVKSNEYNYQNHHILKSLIFDSKKINIKDRKLIMRNYKTISARRVLIDFMKIRSSWKDIKTYELTLKDFIFALFPNFIRNKL